MAVNTTSGSKTAPSRDLRRSIGFFGLMFISLGSIIGSGWLLGALGAAKAAGPASLISWILAALMLMTLALVHAELGAAYPVAGGTARFPYFAFGTLAGFTAGWAAYLQAVTIAPIEVEAAISYLNSTKWAHAHLDMLNTNGTLNGLGLVIATAAMLLFTIINLLGAKLLSDSNTVMVIWKAAVPILAVIVIMSLSFHASNFTAGGGFAPYGAHGVFAALPAGVVFALQGFEQAVQMGGEARDPEEGHLPGHHLGDVDRRRRLHPARGRLHRRSVVVQPDARVGEPDRRRATSARTTRSRLRSAPGGWATILLVDAVISPGGTGLIYLGTSARLSYALAEEEVITDKLTETNKRGVPIYSILLAFVIGELTFLPFPSWNSLVGLVTGATAIMYAFAPVSLAALHLRDPERSRPYRCPFPKVMNPVAFCAANLIIYWGGFEAMWKLLTAIFLGRVLFEVALRRSRGRAAHRHRLARGVVDLAVADRDHDHQPDRSVRRVTTRCGTGGTSLVVILFSLAIFYYAVSLAMEPEKVKAAVESEKRQLEREKDLNLPG